MGFSRWFTEGHESKPLGFFSQEIGTNLNEFINNSSSNDNEKLRNVRLFETVLVFCFVLFFRFCLFVFVCFVLLVLFFVFKQKVDCDDICTITVTSNAIQVGNRIMLFLQNFINNSNYD